ncbi:MAG: hypothetical protein K2L31_08895 [Muribaculum sp.]|nr:hypothetical protein [Muribaculum sp.]
MKKMSFSAVTVLMMCSCVSQRQVSNMNEFVARYSNGYILDADWDVVGYARNGYISTERNEIVARYYNGRVYDCLDSVIAVYSNGCIYSDRPLWDIYDRIDMSNYIKDQKGKE